jgi:hypothetical protein
LFLVLVEAAPINSNGLMESYPTKIVGAGACVVYIGPESLFHKFRIKPCLICIYTGSLTAKKITSGVADLPTSGKKVAYTSYITARWFFFYVKCSVCITCEICLGH